MAEVPTFISKIVPGLIRAARPAGKAEARGLQPALVPDFRPGLNAATTASQHNQC